MVTSEVLQYVAAGLRTGIGKDAIAASLAQSGWQPGDIAEIFAAAEKQLAPAPALAPTPLPVRPTAELRPVPPPVVVPGVLQKPLQPGVPPPQAAAPVQPLGKPAVPQPMAPPPATPPQAAYNPPAIPPVRPTPARLPQASRGHHWGSRIVIGFLLLVVLGAGGAYAWAYAAPGAVLKLTAAHMQAVPAYHSDLELSFDSESGNGRAAASVLSDVDQSDSEHPNFQSHIKGSVGAMPFDADARFVNGSVYLRLNTLPILTGATSQYLGQWFVIRSSDAQSLGGNAPLALSTAAQPKISLGDLAASGAVTYQGVPTVLWDSQGPALRYAVAVDSGKLVQAVIASAKISSPLLQQRVADIQNEFAIGPIVYNVSLLNRSVDYFELPITITLPPATAAELGARFPRGQFGAGPYHLLLTSTVGAVGVPVSPEEPHNALSLVDLLVRSMSATTTPAAPATPPALLQKKIR